MLDHHRWKRPLPGGRKRFRIAERRFDHARVDRRRHGRRRLCAGEQRQGDESEDKMMTRPHDASVVVFLNSR
jgi:hypothetical protein